MGALPISLILKNYHKIKIVSINSSNISEFRIYPEKYHACIIIMAPFVFIAQKQDLCQLKKIIEKFQIGLWWTKDKKFEVTARSRNFSVMIFFILFKRKEMPLVFPPHSYLPPSPLILRSV